MYSDLSLSRSLSQIEKQVGEMDEKQGTEMLKEVTDDIQKVHVHTCIYIYTVTGFPQTGRSGVCQTIKGV